MICTRVRLYSSYRLAPENLFPAAVVDSVKVSRYFIDNAENYGVDGKRIGIRGEVLFY